MYSSDPWTWAGADGYSSWHPDWYGPECFEIAEPEPIYFSGQVRYSDPRPPDTTWEPARNTLIRLYDIDGATQQLLAEVVTDNQGYFYCPPVSYDDWKDGDPLFGPASSFMRFRV